jgi:hypothetical protein
MLPYRIHTLPWSSSATAKSGRRSALKKAATIEMGLWTVVMLARLAEAAVAPA